MCTPFYFSLSMSKIRSAYPVACNIHMKNVYIMKFKENLGKKEVKLEDQYIYNPLIIWCVSFIEMPVCSYNTHTVCDCDCFANGSLV